MAAYFFDSSSLVKRYARERGTSWTFDLVRRSTGTRLYLALITGAEVVAALTKKERSGTLAQATMQKAVARFEREFANKFVLIDVTPVLVNRAVQLIKKHPLRSYDAVQLAAALTANAERLSLGATALTLISADDNLNNAAHAEGLGVDNPNHHP